MNDKVPYLRNCYSHRNPHSFSPLALPQEERCLNPNRLLDCSVTMEPHCAFKASKYLLKNLNCYHHNANDRFGLKDSRELALTSNHYLLRY